MEWNVDTSSERARRVGWLFDWSGRPRSTVRSLASRSPSRARPLHQRAGQPAGPPPTRLSVCRMSIGAAREALEKAPGETVTKSIRWRVAALAWASLFDLTDAKS